MLRLIGCAPIAEQVVRPHVVLSEARQEEWIFLRTEFPGCIEKALCLIPSQEFCLSALESRIVKAAKPRRRIALNYPILNGVLLDGTKAGDNVADGVLTDLTTLDLLN